MLDYKLIEAFSMVILEGGFEKAARRLHLTQSAISQRVRQLEELYGSVLLNRTSPPEPTPSGLPLFIHYKKVQQLEADLDRQNAVEEMAYTSLAICVNADTLETWFLPAVVELLQRDNIVLDLRVDDQDKTHELLKAGTVSGCITTRARPQQGCSAEYLGTVRYGIFATAKFQRKWFASGLSIEAFQNAPMARFNRKDELSSQILSAIFGSLPDAIADHSGQSQPPVFFVPSTDIYGSFVLKDLCWGVLPEQQSHALEDAGKIINLSPSHWVDVELYWHSWSLKSKSMQHFSQHFIKCAKMILRN